MASTNYLRDELNYANLVIEQLQEQQIEKNALIKKLQLENEELRNKIEQIVRIMTITTPIPSVEPNPLT